MGGSMKVLVISVRYLFGIFFIIGGILSMPTWYGFFFTLFGISLIPKIHEILLRYTRNSKKSKVLRRVFVIVPIILFIIAIQLSPAVYNSKLRKITIENSPVSIRVGDEVDLVVSTNVEDYDLGSQKWESSDNTIAVIESGHLIGVGEGSCTISAKSTDGISASVKIDIQEKLISINNQWENRKEFLINATRNTLAMPYYYVNDNINFRLSDSKYKDTPYYFSGSRVQKTFFGGVEELKDNEWLLINKIGISTYIVYANVPAELDYPKSKSFVEIWGTLSGGFLYNTTTNIVSTIHPPKMDAKIVKVDGIIVYEDKNYFTDVSEDTRSSFYRKAKNEIQSARYENATNILFSLGDYLDSKELIMSIKDSLYEELTESIKEYSNPFKRNFSLELVESAIAYLKSFDILNIKEKSDLDRYVDQVKLIYNTRLKIEDTFPLWDPEDYHPDIISNLASSFIEYRNTIISSLELLKSLDVLNSQDIVESIDFAQFKILVLDKVTSKDINGNIVVNDHTKYRWKTYYFLVPWDMKYLENSRDKFFFENDLVISGSKYKIVWKTNNSYFSELHIFR